MASEHHIRINIPETDQKRVLIIGGGFAGLTMARRLATSDYQVVLIDKNNYHQFQPLFYQVAMAGLEPSSIAFPFRRLLRRNNVYLRVTDVLRVEPEQHRVITPLGHCNYDYLVIATGANTNFFGNQHIEDLAIPMKSVSEALYLRNVILEDYEKALTTLDYDQRQGLIDIVIVGGGPTGVELAGSLAEMRKFVLPKDYHELDLSEIDIYLIQSGDQLLKGMSAEASAKSLQFLQELGVKVLLNNRVTDYDGERVYMQDGSNILTRKLIWAAGIQGAGMPGLPDTAYTRGGRLTVNEFLQVSGYDNIYALGDTAYMEEPDYPQGHPQVAQVAIQQGKRLAKNLRDLLKDKAPDPFHYHDKGSMATVGRHRAVVDLPQIKFQGYFAWLVWLLVHLFSILGVRNRVVVFLNWLWNYFTYDQTLRLIIRPRRLSLQSE